MSRPRKSEITPGRSVAVTREESLEEDPAEPVGEEPVELLVATLATPAEPVEEGAMEADSVEPLQRFRIS